MMADWKTRRPTTDNDDRLNDRQSTTDNVAVVVGGVATVLLSSRLLSPALAGLVAVRPDTGEADGEEVGFLSNDGDSPPAFGERRVPSRAFVFYNRINRRLTSDVAHNWK